MNKFFYIWMLVPVLIYIAFFAVSRVFPPAPETSIPASLHSTFTYTLPVVATPNPYFFSESARLGKEPITIARISNRSDLERGLSGQPSLPENGRLLFVFDVLNKYGIWMKDMLFPIDVVWLDQNLTVVSIKSDFLPSTYPEVAFPTQNSLYVLELPAGFTRAHHINIGDKLTF